MVYRIWCSWSMLRCARDACSPSHHRCWSCAANECLTTPSSAQSLAIPLRGYDETVAAQRRCGMGRVAVPRRLKVERRRPRGTGRAWAATCESQSRNWCGGGQWELRGPERLASGFGEAVLAADVLRLRVGLELCKAQDLIEPAARARLPRQDRPRPSGHIGCQISHYAVARDDSAHQAVLLATDVYLRHDHVLGHRVKRRPCGAPCDGSHVPADLSMHAPSMRGQ
jgi:hypothetical protein